jgi:hypothetical protein
VPVVFAACLAACAARFACKWASELARPGLSSLAFSSASWRQIALSSPVRPWHAEKSGAVSPLFEVVASASGASVSGASVSVGSGASVSAASGDGEGEMVTEGLGEGFPCTPPVAALAIVPAAMIAANTIMRVLSGFMGLSIGRTTRDRDWANG